jgi:glycosyltransferase involved in cell wall biosynthesis
MTDPLPLSVVILTLNEEARLPATLASVARCDDLVVVDSGSTDQTQNIARAAGARVLINPFVNFAEQRNFAHVRVEFRHPWVFHLDADEIMTPELATECAALSAATPVDGYYAAPRMMFAGHWLKHCTDFPAWQARCVRARGFQFIQAGHGQREAAGMRMGYLRSSYEHDISVDDESIWEAKHRRYAREEALAALQHAAPLAVLMRRAFRDRGLDRRRALKQLSYSLPFRPSLRFIYQYILRGGFLDGVNAYRYCRLLARYERFAGEEIRRLQSSASHG